MQPSVLSRRELLAAGATALGGTALAAGSVSAAEVRASDESIIGPGATVLFQGDSITDARRKRDYAKPNDAIGLGTGYAFLAATQLQLNHAGEDLQIYNRGISGHKVVNLAERWKRDCIDLKPDVVSILIGVNDIWHRLKGKYDGTIETYRNDYHTLVEQTKAKLPNAKLVICEPFVLKVGAVSDDWFPLFDEFRAAAKEVADKHADAWVPFQAMFNAAEKLAPATTWLRDGVHPAPAGAALMANAWLKAVGE